MTTQRGKDQEQVRGSVLVADDEPGMRLALREVLRRGGWTVRVAESAEEALEVLAAEGPFALMLTDYRMPGMTGLELVRIAARDYPAMPTVMMTAYGTVEDAVNAMKEGAADYLLKPFSFDAVTEVVRRATRRGAEQVAHADDAQTARPERGLMIGSSAAFAQIVRIAEDVATADSTVILMGESGTGKEVLARHIHACSGRTGPFVGVNCAALPEGLLESELFGHEKGAFTGAQMARKGRFEQAQGGTLLLDEISEMPLGLQAKLLRVLQEREVTPVGSPTTVKLDTRVIATTNRDLDLEVREGRFRKDLFFRLHVIALPVPALRERPEDVLPLAESFLKKHQRAGRPAMSLSREAAAWLRGHAWPGNVRELENMIERACLLTRGMVIQPEDLALNLKPHTPLPSPAGASAGFEAAAGLTLEEMERRMILATLDQTGGNRTKTADLLGVSVRTIRNKLHQYGFSEAV